MDFPDAPLIPTDPALRWRTVKVPQGDSVKGFIVGKLRPVECHWVQESSKPCRHKMTGGKLGCYCATEAHTLRTIGYVPVETRDREQVCVIVPKTTAIVVQSLALGQPVEFARPDREKSATRVRTILVSELGERHAETIRSNCNRSISKYLFHLWGDLVLTAYFEKLGAPSSDPPSYPPLIRKHREKKALRAPQSDTTATLRTLVAGIGQSPDSR